MDTGADTYDAPHPPVPEWTESFTTDSIPALLEGFSIDPESKEALVSFIATGRAPQDEVKRLYDICLSELSGKENTAMDNNGMSSLTQTYSLPTPALPPTPTTMDEDTAQDLLQCFNVDADLREFFISLLASGRAPHDEVRKLYNISILAGNEDFDSLMESARSLRDRMCGQTYGMNLAAYMDLNSDDINHPQHSQPLQQPPPPFHPISQISNQHFLTHDATHASPLVFTDTSPYALFSSDMPQISRRESIPSYIAPTVLDQPGIPPLGNDDLTSPLTTNFLSHDTIGMASNFDQPNGLPSPVTQASNQSDGSSTPSGNQANGGGAEVVCPLHNPDGSICGKRCNGAKPYRSMQEHIRRAHPDRYLPGLPANEESFQAMVDTEGILCTITVTGTNGTICGERFTGSKQYRSIQDHIRDVHPDRFIPGLPANEASFRIMIENPACVVCPLPLPDGTICSKRCFGEKRYRSMQEHIRRAHPPYYIPGLHANEESFQRMTSSAPGATATPQQGSGTNGSPVARPVGGQEQQAQSQGNVPKTSPAVTNAEVASQQQMVAAPEPKEVQQTFESPFFTEQGQATGVDATLAPSLLSMNAYSPMGYQQATSQQYLQYQFPGQQQFQLMAQPYFQQQQQQSLGLSVATPTAQNLDQTLSRGLFNSQSVFGTTQAMQAVYGNAFNAGLEQSTQQYSYPAGQTVQQQQHAASLSPLTPQSFSNSALPSSNSSPRKRKLSEAHVVDGRSQGQPSKKPSVRQNVDTTTSPVQPNGGLISQAQQHIAANDPKPVLPTQTNQNADASATGYFSPPVQVNLAHVPHTQPQQQAIISTVSMTPTKGKSTQAKSASHYFKSPTSSKQTVSTGGTTVAPSPSPKKPSRPARGVVSSLPIPPLTTDQFGLIQEELAEDPFRLLIAVSFLVRTPGKTAIPAYRKLMERCPTPQALAATSRDELKAMINHLGLVNQRMETIHKYAKMWVERPPTKDVRYGVKDYPRKGDAKDVKAGEVFGSEDAAAGTSEQGEATAKARGFGTAWEIGHMTFGRYAIDSWRIFCRDKLLGRAEDWKGKGREPTFQPEWMRVLPEDKELRACLRWMWMKEGWSWDPMTGDKTPLSEETRVAVNEGRVRYDNLGQLVVFEKAQEGQVGGGAAPANTGSAS